MILSKTKIGIFLFHLLVVSSCVSFSTVRRGLNSTNNQGEKVGFWREVEDSRIYLTRYRQGKKKGKEIVVFADDSYVILGYKKGEPHGKKRFYRKDGVIYKIELYRNGVLVKEESFSPLW